MHSHEIPTWGSGSDGLTREKARKWGGKVKTGCRGVIPILPWEHRILVPCPEPPVSPSPGGSWAAARGEPSRCKRKPMSSTFPVPRASSVPLLTHNIVSSPLLLSTGGGTEAGRAWLRKTVAGSHHGPCSLELKKPIEQITSFLQCCCQD